MNYQEFAGKIRQKYPGSYDDMDDQTLARKIVDKYPQYSDVTFDQAPGSVGGFLQNAVTDAKNTVGALGSIGRKVMEAPYDAIQGARQMMGGAKFGDTTIGQNVHAAGEAIRGAVPHLQYGPGGGLELEPGAIARQYQDIGAQPFKMLPGKAGEAFKQAYPNNPFYDQPVTTALALAPVAKPLLGAVPGVASVAGKAQAAAGWAADRTIPAFLKATKGTPLEVSKMAMRDPSIMDLPGNGASLQGRSQDIINAIKEANSKVGGDFRQAYSQQGLTNPVDDIINERTPYSAVQGSRSYAAPGELVEKTQNIPGRSYEVPGDTVRRTESVPGRTYQTSGAPASTGVNPNDVTLGRGGSVSIPGRSYEVTEQGPSKTVNVPGRSYNYTEQGPDKTVSVSDVAGTRPASAPVKNFDSLRDDYHAALSGDLFKTPNRAGGFGEMSDVDKLDKLTELKRSLQDQAIYPAPGQQLSPSHGAMNAAIKKMAGQIDDLRGRIPGGEKLAVADDAYVEMLELKHRLMSVFKDPYTGQDYLNRILKGNTDWLTSGRMAGKVGAIQRVEQITGKKVLEPALREMAAAYINNPDVLSLPGFDLKSIVGALVPTKAILRAGAKLRPSMFKAVRVAAPTTPATGAASVGVAAEQAQAERQRRPIPLGVIKPEPKPLFRKAS